MENKMQKNYLKQSKWKNDVIYKQQYVITINLVTLHSDSEKFL